MAQLALSRLELSHFRSHKKFLIESDTRPIAIHGSNGAGKTNILEAISMLSPGRGLRRARTAELSRQPENIGWKILAGLESLGQFHEIESNFSGEGSRSVQIDGKSAPQLALGRIARVVWLVPVMDRLWLDGAEGRRRFLDRMAMSFAPEHAEEVLKYERAMRERNKMLKDGVSDPSWYRAIEGRMAEAGAQIEQNRLMTLERLMAAQAGAKTEFPVSDLSLAGKDNQQIFTDPGDLATALEENRPQDSYAGRSLIGPHRDDLLAIYSDKGVEARFCSTGEQKALLISLILANGRALTQDFGAAPIMLLDEVAAHLDPDRRAALYQEILALGAQAWMTGTDAGLFEELGKDALQLAIAEGEGGSVILEKDGQTC